MRIAPPDLRDYRAILVDWIELNALSNPSNYASFSILRFAAAEAIDEDETADAISSEEDDEIDRKILEKIPDDLIERAIEEIEFRIGCYGKDYPFSFEEGQKRVKGIKFTGTGGPKTGGFYYCFCLLISAVRHKQIIFRTGEKYLEYQIGVLFQICSCLAVAGYLDGEIVSFGAPRATGDGFYPALKKVWERHGNYRPIEKIPHGFDIRLQDGGLDIICWKHFGDRFASTLLVFVQVASGLNWKGKSIIPDIKQLDQWMESPRFEHSIPALAIPMPLWCDLEENRPNLHCRGTGFYDGVRCHFAYREPMFGLIFDRGRIATLAPRGLKRAESEPGRVDGASLLPEIEGWIRKVLEGLQAAQVGE
jgi:hypothetical protein